MLISIFASMSVLCAAVLALIVGKKNQFHPVVFFLLFAIVDVFFPALYWQLYGQVDNPEWLQPLSDNDILVGITYYSIFLFIFIVSFLMVDGGKLPQFSHLIEHPKMYKKITRALWILFILTLADMASEVINQGGMEAWFWSKFVFAAITDANTESSIQGGFLAWLPLRAMFQAVVGVAFFYRKRLNSPKLMGFFFPAVAIILAMLTFLRGTVLICLITLIFAEVMRHKAEGHGNNFIVHSNRRLKFLVITVFAGILSLYVYGAIRDNFRGIASDTEGNNNGLSVPTFFTAGHGLLGVSHITADYGKSVDFLLGKTYLDMLLLPVPRIIYASKPNWYGIDDITRGMGWPESTQSAVTMPGEAYANFGFWGLLVAILFGVGLGWLQRLIRANEVRFILLGSIVFFQLSSVANWMSFTGVMNCFFLILFLFILSAYLVHSNQGRHALFR